MQHVIVTLHMATVLESQHLPCNNDITVSCKCNFVSRGRDDSESEFSSFSFLFISSFSYAAAESSCPILTL